MMNGGILQNVFIKCDINLEMYKTRWKKNFKKNGFCAFTAVNNTLIKSSVASAN